MVKLKNDMRRLKQLLPTVGVFRQFRIGVSINQGSQTVTLFKGRKSRFDTLFNAHKSYKGPVSTVLINRIFFVLRVGVDTEI